MKFGIIFGANSYEHEISIVSAIVLKDVLKADLNFIFIDKNREFYLIEQSNMKAVYFSNEAYKKSKKLSISNGGFYLNSFMKQKKLETDCYINLVHGQDGEDGKIAGLFEFYEIPFIGPRLEASVLSYSKELTKLLAKNCGVKTLDYQVIQRNDEIKINFPFILKPLRLGSSIGVSVVKEQNQLDYALDVAFEFDDEILVEPFIQDVKEYNLAGFKAGDEFVFSEIEEPLKNEFLNFEQKYQGFSGEVQNEKPKLSDNIVKNMQNSFKTIYDNGRFNGALIRCDFFMINDEIYLNEINPNPGSLANYLFDDFSFAIKKLASSTKLAKKINITYKFINSITKNKGSKLS